MSATAAADAAPPAKGKKKLILIIAVVLLVVLGGGGAALMLTKKKHADGEEGAEDTSHAPSKAVAKFDPKAVPVFVPLDPFTVNLADRESERYAQVGITLEIDDAKTGEAIKVYMPAIRNNILMAIADRSATELMDRGGKAKLADKIRKETSRALGYEIEEEDEAAAADEEEKPAKGAKAKKKKKKAEPPPLPVRAVHFSNFIIQ